MLPRTARRSLALLILAAFLPAGVGCFGSFNLTRKVYDFNRTVSGDKWIRWLFFLGMNVLPVYGFSVFIDAVFANSVEFWSGDNPISARRIGETRVAFAPDGSVLRATWRGPERLELDHTAADGRRRVVVLSPLRGSPEGAVAEARDGSGRLLARAVQTEQGLRLVEHAAHTRASAR